MRPRLSLLCFQKILLNIVLYRFEILFDLLRGGRSDERYCNYADRGEYEGGEELVDSKYATELTDNELPEEDHTGSAYHTGDSACFVESLPEE